jgi:hypothetical protein
MAVSRFPARLSPAMIRRGIVVALMMVAAYLFGAWLGRFTVAGLGMAQPPHAARTLDEALVELADRAPAIARAHPSPVAPDAAATDAGSAAHVCEGCDAHIGRDAQLSMIMGLYGTSPENGEAQPSEAPAVPATHPLTDDGERQARNATPARRRSQIE